jgi:hypothetical protein
VLRTVNDQPTLWDSILPPELLLLPVGWMRCWTTRCSSRRSPRISMLGSGRPSIPVETYLRFRFPAAPRLKAQVRESSQPGLFCVNPTMSTNRATILGHRLAAHALPQGRHHLRRGRVPARRTADVDVVRGPDDRHGVQGSGGCRRPRQGPGFRRCRSTPKPGQRQPATTQDSRAQNRG